MNTKGQWVRSCLDITKQWEHSCATRLWEKSHVDTAVQRERVKVVPDRREKRIR